jgi:hypothetical protein
VFDLDYKTYSIAAALAEQGFDVYLMDHTGFGRSPRPTMDDPCNVDPSQQQLLIPNPLSAPCSASYPHHLVTIFTERAEIDSVVDDIRKKTDRDRISSIVARSGQVAPRCQALVSPTPDPSRAGRAADSLRTPRENHPARWQRHRDRKSGIADPPEGPGRVVLAVSLDRLDASATTLKFQ